MATYKFVIEYAGTRYSGWQEQKNALTVAGELRRALAAVVGDAIELGGAGRTDAGVHAIAQVAHVKLPREFDTHMLLRSVNAGLPADVNVLSVTAADDRFHARHQAVSRAYLYQIATRRTAFGKRYVWWIEQPLDLHAMQAAAVACVGEHDFASFCERAQEQDETRVRVDRAQVELAGALILVRFEASHFLWRMVRRLTGALVQVGRGTLSVQEFRALIDARALATPAGGSGRGAVAEWTAPPSGLFLEAVRYPGDAELGPLAPAFPIDALGPRTDATPT